MVPMKTCCLDCVYCQLGPTTVHTAERREYVEVDEIIAELEDWLATGGAADYLTFAGCGEPTLNSELGDAMARARALSGIPVCLLTNGALLWREDVRSAALQADLIAPSLDVATEATLAQINRPVPEITLARYVEGLRETVCVFRGEVWPEVMLVAGMNDLTRNSEALAEAVADRSGARADQYRGSPLAGPGGPTRGQSRTSARPRDSSPRAEVISSAWEHAALAGAMHDEAEVLALISHRPATLQDVVHGLGITCNEATAYVAHLLADGRTPHRDSRRRDLLSARRPSGPRARASSGERRAPARCRVLTRQFSGSPTPTCSGGD